MNYKRRGNPKGHRNGHYYGMGVRPTFPDEPSKYRTIKSAKKFIILKDSTNCLTICYERFLYTGYGCKKIECVHDEPKSILERHGDKLCWNSR